MFDERKFKAQMVMAGVTQAQLATFLRINVSTLYRKIKNNGDFSREEISKLVDILHIDNPQDIFFARELTETQGW